MKGQDVSLALFPRSEAIYSSVSRVVQRSTSSTRPWSAAITRAHAIELERRNGGQEIGTIVLEVLLIVILLAGLVWLLLRRRKVSLLKDAKEPDRKALVRTRDDVDISAKAELGDEDSRDAVFKIDGCILQHELGGYGRMGLGTGRPQELADT